jgi:hypothetical protein
MLEKLEDELISIVKKIIEEQETHLSKAEITEILKELNINLDSVVSTVIKRHLVEIAKFVIETFKEKE